MYHLALQFQGQTKAVSCSNSFLFSALIRICSGPNCYFIFMKNRFFLHRDVSPPEKQLKFVQMTGLIFSVKKRTDVNSKYQCSHVKGYQFVYKFKGTSYLVFQKMKIIIIFG